MIEGEEVVEGREEVVEGREEEEGRGVIEGVIVDMICAVEEGKIPVKIREKIFNNN